MRLSACLPCATRVFGPQGFSMHATERRFPPAARCAFTALALFLGGFALAQTPAPSARLLVSDVIITGNRQVPTQEIMGRLKTRPGLEYNPDTAQEDVRGLWATKKFGNIQVETRPDGDKVK